MKGSKTYLLEKGIEGTLEEKTERTLVLKDSRNRFRRPSIAQVLNKIPPTLVIILATPGKNASTYLLVIIRRVILSKCELDWARIDWLEM